jgi:hypothetical protein
MNRSHIFVRLSILPLLCLVFISPACSKEKKYASVSAFLRSDSRSASAGFPFRTLQECPYPTIQSEGAGRFVLGDIRGSTACFYNGDAYTVRFINLTSGNLEKSLSFPDLNTYYGGRYAKCLWLDENMLLWHSDSSLVVLFDAEGNKLRELNLFLQHEGKTFSVSGAPNTRWQFHKASGRLIVPLNCLSDYGNEEEHGLPLFAACDIQTGQATFLPLHKPSVYPAGRHLDALAHPFTALNGDVFYMLFPLHPVLYAYNLASGTLQEISLPLAVALTPPASVQSGNDWMSIAMMWDKATRLAGFTLRNGRIFVQQVDGWNESMKDEKFRDHTMLYIFDVNGGEIWAGAFGPSFSGAGPFGMVSGATDALWFTARGDDNSLRLVKLEPEL